MRLGGRAFGRWRWRCELGKSGGWAAGVGWCGALGELMRRLGLRARGRG